MAVIQKVYTPANIFVGPADIYIGLTAPPSALVPNSDTNTLVLDASGQPTSSTGFHAGLVAAPTMPTVTEKMNEIMADQFETAVDVGFDTIEAEIDFILKETNLSRLNTMMSNDGLNTYSALSGALVLQVGGAETASVNMITICAISQQRNTTSKFNYWFLYRAYLASAVPFSFNRSKENEWKCKFKGVADTTRVMGDEVMQVSSDT